MSILFLGLIVLVVLAIVIPVMVRLATGMRDFSSGQNLLNCPHCNQPTHTRSGKCEHCHQDLAG